jgi:hypothetical protein
MKPINFASRRYFKPAALVLAFTVLLLSLAIVIQLPPPPKAVPPAPGPAAFHKASPDSRLVWYFESGQWRADVHTLVNLVTYLVRPEPSPLTNQPSLHAEAQAALVSPAPTQS